MAGKVIGSDALAERNATDEIPKIEDMRRTIREFHKFESSRKTVLKNINAEMMKTAKDGDNVFYVDMLSNVKRTVYEVILQELTDAGYFVRLLGPGDLDQETAREMLASGIPGKIIVMIPMKDTSTSDRTRSSGSEGPDSPGI